MLIGTSGASAIGTYRVPMCSRTQATRRLGIERSEMLAPMLYSACLGPQPDRRLLILLNKHPAISNYAVIALLSGAQNAKGFP